MDAPSDPLRQPAWINLALASGGIGVWRWDARSGRVEWSPEVEMLYGIPQGSFAGTYADWLAFMPAEDRAQAEAMVAGIMAGSDHDYVNRYRIHRADGALRWIESRGTVVRENGTSLGMMGTVMDVTDRVVAEQALDDSRKHLRDLISTIPAIIVQVDRQTRIVFINRVVEGVDASSVLGSFAADWVDPAYQQEYRSALERCMHVPVTVELEFDAMGPGGTTSRYFSRMRGIWRNQECLGAYCIGNDVTSQVEAQRALRESEARLRSAADSMPFTFWVRDAQGRLILQNRYSREHFGDQIGNAIEDMPLPSDLLLAATQNMRRALAGEVVRQEVATVTERGERVFEAILAPVRDGDRVIGVLGCDLDITDQRRLEEQLNRAAREESIGRLAGGVAHDFNNLLTAILGYADLGLAAYDDPARVRSVLERVIEAGRRGAALTKQLLAYARRQPAALHAVDVLALVERVGRLVHPLMGELIDVRLDVTPGLPAIQADPVLLEQVLINLAVNARDAMPNGGRMVMAADLTQVGEEAVLGRGDSQPGPYVRFTVSDQGVGMTPDIQARLFEPFFTTKPVGKGTGLGLASSHGIVRQHHGFITVDSTPGEGTTFSVYVPIALDRHGDSGSGNHPAIRGKGEVILVVEDEPLIRDMVVSALGSLGYKVLAADHGEAALVIAECADRLDVVVTDLVMPRLSGGELVTRLREQRPHLPALYMSGYAEDTARPVLRERDAFLPKPFATSALAQALYRMLN